MIKTLEIKNFKSIKQLKLDCKRINIFIGEPNTGKSNILETIGILSFHEYSPFGDVRNFVRFERTSNLFYDENLDEEIEIRFDDRAVKILFKDGGFKGESEGNLNLSGNYDVLHADRRSGEFSSFKFYRFAPKQKFEKPHSDFLLPPSGDNLLSLLHTHRELRSTANRLFSSFGLRLGLRPHEGRIEVIKQLEDIIISYPYSLTSDTLQRVIFYLSAVLSNKDSIIAFEEPESHAFPYYTKYLAETIALDKKNNQYFISTHNPYFLLPLLGKSPEEEIAVFITYFEDYQTKAKPLSNKELEELGEIDIFANIDRFLKAR